MNEIMLIPNNTKYTLSICKSPMLIPTYKSYRAMRLVKVTKYKGILYKQQKSEYIRYDV